MLVALDGTILLVAQPSMQRDLDASMAQIQWTSTGYLVAVAALLVIAGRLGDRYGHQRLLLIGVLGFGSASAGIALAPNVGWVIALRAAQGAFGALLQPATLALLRLAYPADRLGTPIAIRTSAIAVAAGSGPILGGLLVAHLGWRAVFWVNVPVALALAAAAVALPTLVGMRTPTPTPTRTPTPTPAPRPTPAPTPTPTPTPERTGSPRLNLTGAGLLAIALAVLVHALAGVPARGWTATPTLLELLAAAVIATALIRHERRTAQPIIPPAVARSAPVTASMAMLLVTTAGLFGALFRATFYLQDTLRLDPLASGLRVLPMTALMVLGAPAAGAALRRYGARHTAITGSALVVAGIAGLSRLGPTAPWPAMSAAFAVIGAGFATVMVTATGTVVGDAPPGYAGVVGGLKQTAVNIGPTLGIAVAAGTTGSAAPTMSPTPLHLAALAALGLLPASRLPGRLARAARPARPARPARRGTGETTATRQPTPDRRTAS
ncbi:MFS transporter [Streptomyces varsoviensis]|uniref:MFS transporter n=1 Tax=Streptomyces varsoviensis TaxID=67373 RepID=UPI00099775AE|nr:MFS transporter [Streptomyces varsoviensis]